MKKVPSLGQTDSVCQAEPLHGSTGLANTQATLVGVRDFLSLVSTTEKGASLMTSEQFNT